MKSTQSKIVLTTSIISIIALIILFIVWWVNGRDNTWFYITAATIVLASFLYISPRKKE